MFGRLRDEIAKAQREVYANLSGPALAEAVEELTQVRHEFDALDLAVTGAFDASAEWTVEGHASAAAYLTQRCGERPGTAKKRTRLARCARTMPHAAAALSAGEISLDRFDVLARAASASAMAEAFERDEELLVDKARDLHFDDLVRAMRYWSDINSPDDPDEKARKQDDDRWLNLAHTLDHMGDIKGLLTPLARRVVGGELERLERQFFEDDWAEARERLGDAATQADLRRTSAQRRHDALYEMARRSMGADGPVDPNYVVNLVSDLPTFATELERYAAELGGEDPNEIPYPSARICEMDDGTVLTPAQMLTLAFIGRLRMVVTDEHDIPVKLGRSQRFFSKIVGDVMKLIHRRCTHEFGCDVPSRFCQNGHGRAWIDGGLTDAVNCGPECQRHNLWKERHERRKRPPP